MNELIRHRRDSAVVVSGHDVTTQAAESVLREGGNAFDAVIAGYFTACFAEPMLASVAGGGFLMLQPSGQKARVIDAFVQTPRMHRPLSDLDVEAVKLDFGATTQTFNIGWGTVATPGMVRGVYRLNKELGRVPIRELIHAALEIGRQPIAINDCQAEIFKTVMPVCVTRESAARHFSCIDTSKQLGATGQALDFTALADTLDVLAVEGEEFFYRGEIAALFDHHSKHGGGSIGLLDLERYEAIVRDVETVNLAEASVSLTPAPSAGGVLVAFGLALADASDGLNSGTTEIDNLRYLIDIMRATGEARLDCTEPDGYDWPDAEKILAPAYLQRWQQTISQRARAWRGTTHLSVIDHSGNIASLSTSNGAGCGELLGATGIMPNNMLGETDLSPRGLFNWDLNSRMSSMMTPAIISRADGSRTTLGSGGSNRIRTALLQVMVNLELLNMPLEQAINAPRIHADDEQLRVEGGWSDAVRSHLEAQFPDAHCFDGLSFYFGGVHAASCGPSGVDGSGDSRRGGCAVLIR